MEHEVGVTRLSDEQYLLWSKIEDKLNVLSVRLQAMEKILLKIQDEVAYDDEDDDYEDDDEDIRDNRECKKKKFI